MDAYDIFKKLTRGIKFCNSNNPVFKRNVESKISLEVKKELETESLNINQNGEENMLKDNEIAMDSQNNITLLNSIKKEGVKRGKKRKHESEDDLLKKQKLLQIEEVNHYRNINKINAVGKDVPEPARNFDDFKIDTDILENLKACGYTEPTPIQKQAVPIMLKDQHLLGCAPTGSGKTAAFLVPIIQQLKCPEKRGFRALILCPTRELAKQTQRECVRLSGDRDFKIHVISKIKKALEQYGPKSNKKYDILVTTPKRICYLLSQEPPAISLSNIEWLIIDEADKLFEEGSRGFREQLNQVMAACKNEKRKIAMFSATCTPIVSKWCVRNMKPLIRVTVGHRNAATLTVDQKLLFVGNEHGKLLAFRDIVKKGIFPPVLIFVQSKERAQQLFNELIYDGINVDAIHADRTQLQRDNTVRAFREGKIWVLICTELMARGVDFKGVNLVINYDFPPSAISYIHRIGRAGRAGLKGSAITFFTTEDVALLRSIAYILKESGCEVPPYMLTIKKINKKEKKKMEKAAPKRDDITTIPFYDKKRKRKNKIKPSTEGNVDADRRKNITTNNGNKLRQHFQNLKKANEGRRKERKFPSKSKSGLKSRENTNKIKSLKTKKKFQKNQLNKKNKVQNI